MHPDLSSHLHTKECNELINDLKLCHENHPIRKLFGYCNSIDNLMVKCLKAERLARRDRNIEKSNERKRKIRESNLLNTKFSNVSGRYYEHKYCTKYSTKEQNLDYQISFHSNRICMISLGENHQILKDKKSIKRINCLIDNKTDRLKNFASGKGKRGAQKLDANSVLCYIECDDGTTYPVYSCIKGKLLEINENLLSNPNLLIEKPISEGYIALILPLLSLYMNVKNSMLSKEEYINLN